MGSNTGNLFENETKIMFDTKQASMFIQTNKPLYKQGQTGNEHFLEFLWILFLYSIGPKIMALGLCSQSNDTCNSNGPRVEEEAKSMTQRS